MKRKLDWGIYRRCSLHEPERVGGVERELGGPPGVLSFYRAWGGHSADEDREWLLQLRRTGHSILLTWEPWRLPGAGERPQDQPDYALTQLLRGAHDDYVKRFAAGLAAFETPVLLRPMHEMNGNWYPWCGTVNGNSASLFREAWARLKQVAAEAGAKNVQWIWCPYVRSCPDTAENQIENFFPGDEAVDWIGLDGYNWGTTQPWSQWQTFPQLFESPLAAVRKISKRPVLIAEMACAEEGGDKAAWIEEAFESLKRLDAIRLMIWFDENKECDWRAGSSPRSLHAFRQGVESLAS